MMELIQHTINWTKGEIEEALIMGIVGFLFVISALLFWKLGNTPNAKAMVLPLLIVGMIPLVAGVSGVYTNKKRMIEYTKQYHADPAAFIQSEKERVEAFDEIFKYSYPAAIILLIGGAILFFVFKSPNWKAVSLSLMLIGLMAYFIDHFVAERADKYLEEIKNRTEANNAIEAIHQK